MAPLVEHPGTHDVGKVGDREELFDLSTDISETKNLSEAQPTVLARLREYAREASNSDKKHDPVGR